VAKDFKGRALTAISARNAIAVGADFRGVSFQGAHFDGRRSAATRHSTMRTSGACLSRSNLAQRAKFVKCDLRSLRLSKRDEVVTTNFADAFIGATSFSEVRF